MDHSNLDGLVLREFLLTPSEFEREIQKIERDVKFTHSASLSKSELTFLKNFLDGLLSAGKLSNLDHPGSELTERVARQIERLTLNADETQRIEGAESPSGSRFAKIERARHLTRYDRLASIRSALEQTTKRQKNCCTAANDAFEYASLTRRLDIATSRVLSSTYRLARDKSSAPALTSPEAFTLLVQSAETMRTRAFNELGHRATAIRPQEAKALLARYARRRGLMPERLPTFSFCDVASNVGRIAKTIFNAEIIWGTTGRQHPFPERCEVQIGGEIAGTIYLSFPANAMNGPSFTVPLINRACCGDAVQLPAALVQCPLAFGSGTSLTFQRVHSFTHEMGHALHHICSRGVDSTISGIDSVRPGYDEIVSYLFEKHLYGPDINFPDANIPREHVASILTVKRLEFCLNFLDEVCLSHVDFVMASDASADSFMEVAQTLQQSWGIPHPPQREDLIRRVTRQLLSSYLGTSYRYPVGHAISALWHESLNRAKGKDKRLSDRFHSSALKMWYGEDLLSEMPLVEEATRQLTSFYTIF